MKKKNLLIISALLTILIVLIALYHEQRVPILGYHAFYKDKSELKEDNPEFINDIKNFEKQMKYLRDHNYKTLTLDEFYDWKKGKIDIPRKSVLVTIDDGSLSNYMYAFPILKKYNINAVVFYIGKVSKDNGVDKGTIYDTMSLELIEKCKKEYPNIEFESHSYNLHGKASTLFTKEEKEKDVKEMSKLGEYKYYAFPFGVYDEDMIKILKDNNYKMAFSFGYDDGYRKARKSDDDYHVARLNISNYVSFSKFLLRLYMPY